MKYLSLISVLLFSIKQLTAQVVTSDECNYIVGRPYKVVDAPNKLYFSKENEVMSVKITSKVITVQKFDANTAKEIGRTEFSNMPRGFRFENVVELQDHYYLFFEVWDKEKETEQLFYYEIDFDKGEINGNEERLIAVNGKITGGWVSMYGVANKFDFHTSADKSKLLVQYRKKPTVRNDAESYDVIGMSVFDQDLKEVWGKEVKMPYSEKKMDNIDYSIDAKGNAFILTTVFNDNTTKTRTREGKPNYHIELLTVNSTHDIKASKIKTDGVFLSDVWLFENPKGYMVCAGFYSKGEDIDDADGIYMFKASSDGEITDQKLYEIPVSVLNMYMSERAQKKNEKKEAKGKADFAELQLREVINQEDGSVVLVGEQYYVVVHTSYNASTGSTQTTYTYHYNDILITKINPQGELDWMQKLPKRQTGKAGQGGMSYKYMNDGKYHYLVFLDNVKNIELDINSRPAGHSDGAGGFMTAFRVADKDGGVTKLSILDARAVKLTPKDPKGIDIYQFNVDRIQITGTGEFVFEVYKKKKEDIMIKVAIKE